MKKEKFNILIDGLPSVGKTSFFRRITVNEYDANYINTLPIKDETQIKLLNGHQLKYTLYDISKNEAYLFRRKFHKERIILQILMYDITNIQSFVEVDKLLIELMEGRNKSDNIIIYIVGNKIDLEKERKVHKEEINCYCRYKNIKHFECSVLTGYNVHEIMNSFIRDISNIESNNEIINKDEMFILSDNITKGNINDGYYYCILF